MPGVRRSSRASKAPEKLTFEAPKVLTVESEGQGTALSDISHIVDKVKGTVAREPVLKQIHSFMYGRVGSQKDVKNNILKFNGFSKAAIGEGAVDKLAQKIGKQSLANLKKIFDILCLDRSGASFGGAQPNKDQLVDRAANWLLKPTVSLTIRVGEWLGIT